MGTGCVCNFFMTPGGGLSRKFWSGAKSGLGGPLLVAISGPGDYILATKNGPPLEKLVLHIHVFDGWCVTILFCNCICNCSCTWGTSRQVKFDEAASYKMSKKRQCSCNLLMVFLIWGTAFWHGQTNFGGQKWSWPVGETAFGNQKWFGDRFWPPLLAWQASRTIGGLAT